MTLSQLPRADEPAAAVTVSPTIYVLRGIAASGKTTHARKLQLDLLAAGELVALVGRDRVRDLLHGARTQEETAEKQVTTAQHAMVEALLRSGVSVIVDDTNLNPDHLRVWMEMAVETGARLDIDDRFLNVPLEECLRRDAERPLYEQVGELAIRRMHREWIDRYGGQPPRPKMQILPPAVKYTPVPGTPEVVLVDIDGTVALNVSRDPYDMTRVSEDQPNRDVILAVRAWHAAGVQVIFVSGRDESARADTVAWIDRHVRVPFVALHMREVGDNRRDSIVKQGFFNRLIRFRYTVLGVFDDRQQVVRMWRAMGLTVFQVADGNF